MVETSGGDLELWRSPQFLTCVETPLPAEGLSCFDRGRCLYLICGLLLLPEAIVFWGKDSCPHFLSLPTFLFRTKHSEGPHFDVNPKVKVQYYALYYYPVKSVEPPVV